MHHHGDGQGVKRRQKGRSRLLGALLQGCGFVCVALAVAGIFLPVLPTVPLLLLALACFARSSDRFYLWLLNHRRLGPIVRPYMEGRGVPVRAKVKAILLIWASISLSAVFLVEKTWVRILLPLIAAAVTIYLVRLPNAEAELPPSQQATLQGEDR